VTNGYVAQQCDLSSVTAEQFRELVQKMGRQVAHEGLFRSPPVLVWLGQHCVDNSGGHSNNRIGKYNRRARTCDSDFPSFARKRVSSAGSRFGLGSWLAILST
jgi:hypothetical protein